MLARLTRRYFLQVVAASAASTAGGAACSGANNGGDPEVFGDVMAGNVSALDVGTVRAVPGQPVFVGRDANGIYAMTTTCTHQSCDMASNGTIATHISCTCHGSQFDLNGAVLRGPANRPLAHFAVSVAADGTITVHGGTQVQASDRVSVS